MNEIVLEALKGSIRKHENILSGTESDYGADNCPLCGLFNRSLMDLKDRCVGCPVYEKTGEVFCYNTPYQDWILHCDEEHNGYDGDPLNCPECARLVALEIEFLKSLNDNYLSTK